MAHTATDDLAYESDLSIEERLTTPPHCRYHAGELETVSASHAQRLGLTFLFFDETDQIFG